MAEEQVSVSATEGEEFDPISALNEIKANSVPKSEYQKVVAEKNKYLKALYNGDHLEESSKAVSPSVDELRKDLFSKPLTNMEYIDKALQLRDAVLDADGVDIFVGSGKNFVPTNDDYEAAKRTADAFRSCLDIADGNPEVFRRELERVTVDTAPKRAR